MCYWVVSVRVWSLNISCCIWTMHFVIVYPRRRNICLLEIECKNCGETPTDIITSHTDWIWLNSSLDQPRTLLAPLVTQSEICIWRHLKHSNWHLISTCRLKSYYFDIKFLKKKRLWEMKICVIVFTISCGATNILIPCSTGLQFYTTPTIAAAIL